jgi:hypothetical protein
MYFNACLQYAIVVGKRSKTIVIICEEEGMNLANVKFVGRYHNIWHAFMFRIVYRAVLSSDDTGLPVISLKA